MNNSNVTTTYSFPAADTDTLDDDDDDDEDDDDDFDADDGDVRRLMVQRPPTARDLHDTRLVLRRRSQQIEVIGVWA